MALWFIILMSAASLLGRVAAASQQAPFLQNVGVLSRADICFVNILSILFNIFYELG